MILGKTGSFRAIRTRLREALRPRKRRVLGVLLLLSVALLLAWGSPLGGGMIRARALEQGGESMLGAMDWRTAFAAFRENVIAWRLVTLFLTGCVAGVTTSLMLPSLRVGNLSRTIVLGVCGAIIGGWVSACCGHPVQAALSLSNLGVAFAGSACLLLAMRALSRF